MAAAVALLVSCGGQGPAPPGAQGADPTPAQCGDGVVQGREECDDGNASNEDACLASCLRPAAWVSGDIHLHGHGCGDEVSSPGELLSLVEAAGIQVGSVLVWGVGFEQDRPLFTGRDSPVSTPSHRLRYDLEVSHFDAARGGHLVALGLRSLDFTPAVFHTPTGVPVVDWAHAQGAVVGMAHAQFWPADGRFPQPPGGCCMPWELPVHVARGRLDFLAVEKPGPRSPLDDGAFLLWKSLLNAGFRVPIAGGSDYTCLNHEFGPRTPRTDVLMQGPPSYEGFLDALRKGRSAVAIGRGNRLDLRVNGARLGEEVHVRAGQPLELDLESRFEQPGEVEVLVNGRVDRTLGAEPGTRVGRVSLSLATSAWIAARSRWVATSPVYAIVDGREIRASPEDACYLVRYVEHLSALRPGAQPAYADARDELLRRFTESGGTACP